MTTHDTPAAGAAATLRIGRISYLNVLPLFDALARQFPEGPGVTYQSGHPSELNAALACGDIDLAPASAFAYLESPELFRLLPGLSISAAEGPIQSVLFLSPVPLAELPAYFERYGNVVHLSTASASSSALLKVLWRFAWKLPEAEFRPTPPGTGLELERPFMEIGDAALKLFIERPDGWHITDLGEAWKTFSGLPFVFAVWMVRRGLAPAQVQALSHLAECLAGIKAGLPGTLPGLVGRYVASPQCPDWLTADALISYFTTAVCYDFDPPRMASLAVFGDYCERLGLLPAAPALEWQSMQAPD